MEYLGELGRLVPLRCASTERVQSAPRYVVESTVEGRRRAQVIPRSPRAWDVQWNLAYAAEAATLAQFAEGAWGAGPWHWVSVQAHRGNLLTPRQASLLDRVTRADWANGGPRRAPDGSWTGQSLVSSMTAVYAWVYTGVPVIPGKPVTFSADVAGGTGANPRILMAFQDAHGVTIGSALGATAPSESWQRLSMTEIAPEGAAQCLLGIRGTVTTLARPQVTWTDGPVPYAPGHGCRAAVVDGATNDLLYMADPRRGAYTSHSFTIMEVG